MNTQRSLHLGPEWYDANGSTHQPKVLTMVLPSPPSPLCKKAVDSCP